MPTLNNNQILEIINEAFIDNIVKEEVQDYFFRNPFSFDLLLPAVKGEHVDRSGQLVAVNPGQVFTIIQKMNYEPIVARSAMVSLLKKIDVALATKPRFDRNDDQVEKAMHELKTTGKIAGWMVVVDGLTAWMSNYDLTNIKKNSRNRQKQGRSHED